MKLDGKGESKRKCTHELKALFHRWEEESDLESEEIMECLSDAIDEYYEEDVVEFEADPSLLEDDEGMELGEDEEGS